MKLKFPTIQEMAKDIAEKVLDEYEYEGKSIRQWVEVLEDYDDKQTTLERIVERLEELDDLTLEQYNKSQAGTYEHDFADGKSVGLELAVDIVKEEGGLNGN